MLSSMIVVLTLAGATPESSVRPSYLFQMEVDPTRQIQLRGECYDPQSGDLVLFDDHHRLTTKLYRCCGTAAPLHAGIIHRRTDGSWAILEAGPGAQQKVFIFPLDDRLHSFHGTILIRRLRTPLLAEQAERLTVFCEAQEGKGYALVRLILQGTPFRPQGAIRKQVFGKTYLDRDRWMCSELAVAAITAVGVLDAKTYPANAMYPRDLCYDERYDLSPYFADAALWYPRAQLEHVGSGVRLLDPKAHE